MLTSGLVEKTGEATKRPIEVPQFDSTCSGLHLSYFWYLKKAAGDGVVPLGNLTKPGIEPGAPRGRATLENLKKPEIEPPLSSTPIYPVSTALVSTSSSTDPR
jgi:hypothetical protein